MLDYKDALNGKQPKDLARLIDEPETKKVFSMLSENTGGNLEKAAEKAANGDTTQLLDAIKQLMKDPEGARLIQEMKSKLK